MGKRTNVVIYTRQFPKPDAPTDGLFTAQMAIALNKIANVTVVCPVPWCPPWKFFSRWPDWYSDVNIPSDTQYKSLKVYYPKFLVIPLLARYVQPLFQVLITLPLLYRLKKNGQVDVINAHNLYPDGVGAAIVAKILNIPIVQTSLGSDINANESSKIRLSQAIWAMNAATAVTAKSKALASKIGGLIRTDIPVQFVPNGVSADKFQVPSVEKVVHDKKLLTLNAEDKHLLYVGRFDEVKGLIYLIEALGILSKTGSLDFKTLLVGDGLLKSLLEAKVSSLKIEDKVSFEGKVEHGRVINYLNAAELFCLPSLNEGLPNVVIEALACGVPVVASEVGGIPELVNEQNGILVPSKDSTALANALASAFGRTWSAEKVRETITWANWESSATLYLDVMNTAILKKRQNEKVD